MAETRKTDKQTHGDLDWIIVGYKEIQHWLIIGLLVAAAGVWGFYLFRHTHENPKLRAQKEIERATTTLQSAEVNPEASHFPATVEQARERLNDARAAFDKNLFERAYELGLESESLSRRALGRTAAADMGDATFVALEGSVEIQRAGRAIWEDGRMRESLYDGDFVKTDKDGSAEVMFSDGTLYQIRPDSLFEVQGSHPASPTAASSAVEMVSGSIQVFTAGSPSRVKTRAVSARIEERSQVGVKVDARQNTQVSNYRGQTVLTNGAQTEVLTDRVQISADARTQKLGEKIPLPDTPVPVEPVENRIFDMRKTSEVVLHWNAVKTAASYHVQVSRSRLFIPDATPLDLPNRRQTVLKIRPREEGLYYWRVAAVAAGGVASDWSPYRRFRLVPNATRLMVAGGSPPQLFLEQPEQMGNLFLLFGKTDPGASVSVNGQRADVDPDGSFKTTVTVDQPGVSQIVVKAIDAAGRETAKRINVNVEIF